MTKNIPFLYYAIYFFITIPTNFSLASETSKQSRSPDAQITTQQSLNNVKDQVLFSINHSGILWEGRDISHDYGSSTIVITTNGKEVFRYADKDNELIPDSSQLVFLNNKLTPYPILITQWNLALQLSQLLVFTIDPQKAAPLPKPILTINSDGEKMSVQICAQAFSVKYLSTELKKKNKKDEEKDEESTYSPFDQGSGPPPQEKIKTWPKGSHCPMK